MIKILPSKGCESSIYIIEPDNYDSMVILNSTTSGFMHLFSIVKKYKSVFLFMTEATMNNCIGIQNIISYCLALNIKVELFASRDIAIGIRKHFDIKLKNCISFKNYKEPIKLLIGNVFYEFIFEESRYDTSKSYIVIRKYQDNKLFKEFVYAGSVELINLSLLKEC